MTRDHSVAVEVVVRMAAPRADSMAAGLVGWGAGRKTVCWAGGVDAMRCDGKWLNGYAPGWQEGWPKGCLLD